MNALKKTLQEFQKIPGVGKSIAQDLYGLGFRSVEELKNQNAEVLYERQCVIQRTRVDRCLLYVFRCAVYFATVKNPDPELLKWWNWKGKDFQNGDVITLKNKT